MPAAELLATKSLSSELLTLIEDAAIPGIDDGPKDEAARSQLRTILREEGIQGTLKESGLWLLVGELDRSHDISQSDASQEGSFWHGIMHRREGDFGNSKYWFRRVGEHAVHTELAKQISRKKSQLASSLPVADLSDPATLPNCLVDCCEQVARGNSDWGDSVRQICWWEWELLFNCC